MFFTLRDNRQEAAVAHDFNHATQLPRGLFFQRLQLIVVAGWADHACMHHVGQFQIVHEALAAGDQFHQAVRRHVGSRQPVLFRLFHRDVGRHVTFEGAVAVQFPVRDLTVGATGADLTVFHVQVGDRYTEFFARQF